ncbi:MAG: replicative DNA helicase [Acidobacteriia bacterium]|nr:replicative DNA helicase [Terriglobia bacterium]
MSATAKSKRGAGGAAGVPGDIDGRSSATQVLRIPASEAAERAVLGAVLTDANCFYRVVDTIRPDDFYSEANRLVFEAFANLAGENRDIDLLTTTDQLERSGALAASGGVAYVAGLAEGLPDPANVEHYAAILRERSIKRQLLRISQELMASSAREEGEAMDALDAAETQILSIAERAMRGGLQAVGKLAHEEVAHIERVSKSSAPYTGIETGYYRLDELTSGLQKQDVIILAARPGVGKTALALNIASNCAVRHGLKVAVFSLEMSAVALVRRLLAAEARINVKRLTRGLLSKSADAHQEASDWQRLAEAADRLAEAPLWIDDTAGISVLELRGKCRRAMMEHGLDLVVVDYLQLMSSGAKAENRTQEVSAISRGLKAVAKQLNVPLLVLSQLSRNPDRRGDQRPQLSDLRESGSIEQDADVVMFINRKNRGLQIAEGGGEEEDWRLAEIIIAKQRNGPTDMFKLVFLDEFTRFENPEFSSSER